MQTVNVWELEVSRGEEQQQPTRKRKRKGAASNTNQTPVQQPQDQSPKIIDNNT